MKNLTKLTLMHSNDMRRAIGRWQHQNAKGYGHLIMHLNDGTVYGLPPEGEE